MKVRKAVITAAGPNQRRLPLQNLIDRDGKERSVLAILLEEAVNAGAEEICVVTHPGDQEAYADAAAGHRGRVFFVDQAQPRGYAHAVLCARGFTATEPFLHMVGDHLYVSGGLNGCAAQVVRVAESENCSVSAVQSTRESLITRFGAVGGQKVAGREKLYAIDTVLEKPTPTEAEQKIIVPGQRAGHYLCFFGIHVLTPAVMEILGSLAGGSDRKLSLSDALAELPGHERYLAMELTARRYDLGPRYGVFVAQFALALAGKDRDEILSQLLEVIAGRELAAPSDQE